MMKLEIDDKVYRIPESFEEMTLEQYCKIYFKLPKITEEMDDVEVYKTTREVEATIISRLLNESDDFCLSLPITVYNELSKRVRYIFDVEKIMKSGKASIKIDGKMYFIPPFNEMQLRQYIDADVILQTEENELQYIELLSILLTSKDRNGKWIPYNGEYQELMGKIRQLKCSEALGLCYHFFKKGEALKNLSKLSMKVAESQQARLTASS